MDAGGSGTGQLLVQQPDVASAAPSDKYNRHEGCTEAAHAALSAESEVDLFEGLARNDN